MNNRKRQKLRAMNMMLRRKYKITISFDLDSICQAFRAIAKAAEVLAKTCRDVSKALRGDSPSRVMAESGRYFAKGFREGVQEGVHHDH